MAIEGFAVVEQMGHRRVVGRVSEESVCGQPMLRVETLSDPPIVTFVHPQSLYALHPCDEATARRAGGSYHPLRALEAPVDPLPVPDEPPPDRDEDEDEEGECGGCGAREGEPCRPGCDGGGGEDPEVPVPTCRSCGARADQLCAPGCEGAGG